MGVKPVNGAVTQPPHPSRRRPLLSSLRRIATLLLLAVIATIPFAASSAHTSVSASETPRFEEGACQVYVLGSDTEERTIGQAGVAWEVQVDEAWLADTVEVISVLSAEPPAEVRIVVRHSGELLAQWDQMVTDSRFTEYPHVFTRLVEMAPGDTLRYEVVAEGPPTVRLRISGPNLVRLCRHGVALPAPVFLPMVARKATAPGVQPTVPAPSGPPG